MSNGCTFSPRAIRGIDGSKRSRTSRRWQPITVTQQLSLGLRERQIGTGRMHSEPAVRDSGFNRRAVFLELPPAARKCLLMTATDSRPA
jgi:hypothetical protein